MIWFDVVSHFLQIHHGWCPCCCQKTATKKKSRKLSFRLDKKASQRPFNGGLMLASSAHPVGSAVHV
jgi:hypothetical protein